LTPGAMLLNSLRPEAMPFRNKLECSPFQPVQMFTV
jgi:hypothetical protein